MAAGKNVLMLGPLGNYLGYMESFIHLWDYDYISKIAKTIRGLDINRVLVDVARADGYTGIEFGSAENFSFDQDFDLNASFAASSPPTCRGRGRWGVKPAARRNS